MTNFEKLKNMTPEQIAAEFMILGRLTPASMTKIGIITH